MDAVGRRSFLKAMGSAGMLSALPEAAFATSPAGGRVIEEIAQPAQNQPSKPEHSARFAVAAHHAMARDDHGYRIRSAGTRHCSRGTRLFERLGDLAIGTRGAVGD